MPACGGDEGGGLPGLGFVSGGSNGEGEGEGGNGGGRGGGLGGGGEVGGLGGDGGERGGAGGEGGAPGFGGGAGGWGGSGGAGGGVGEGGGGDTNSWLRSSAAFKRNVLPTAPPMPTIPTIKAPITPKRMVWGKTSSSVTSPMVAFVASGPMGVDANSGLNEGDGCRRSRPGICRERRRPRRSEDAPMLRDQPSPDNASRASGLSDETEKADEARWCPVALPQRSAVEKLNELDHALLRVSECMRAIRSNAEAAKRRREFLDAAIRANLCEMPDGQFTMIQSDKDRYNMLALIMGADQAFADAHTVQQHAFNRTMFGLRGIAEENRSLTSLVLAKPS